MLVSSYLCNLDSKPIPGDQIYILILARTVGPVSYVHCSPVFNVLPWRYMHRYPMHNSTKVEIMAESEILVPRLIGRFSLFLTSNRRDRALSTRFILLLLFFFIVLVFRYMFISAARSSLRSWSFHMRYRIRDLRFLVIAQLSVYMAVLTIRY